MQNKTGLKFVTSNQVFDKPKLEKSLSKGNTAYLRGELAQGMFVDFETS